MSRIWRDGEHVVVTSLGPLHMTSAGEFRRGAEEPPLTFGDVRRFVAEMDAAGLADGEPVHAVIFGSDACGNLRELRALPDRAHRA